MTFFFNDLALGLGMAFGMFWKVGWSLVFGFAISAMLQAFVPKERMQKALGHNGFGDIALATVLGAASSSCSYASASISRTLFKKGAGFIPSLAFLFASTNLVVELGVVLYLLMGWQFTLGEWIGGVVLIVILSMLVKLTYPAKLVEQARRHGESEGAHDHGEMSMPSMTLRQKIHDRNTWLAVAANFAMDFRMLWKDLALGFLIAGFLSALVPAGWWAALFDTKGTGAWQLPLDAALGPLVAVVSFVCSIGNVPMAAVLWASGVNFGGVLSFLYADLIVLPLLDVYRRYYGLKMTVYIAATFYATMVISGMSVDLMFHSLGWIPIAHAAKIAPLQQDFHLDYTFWLNLVFLLLAIGLFSLARKKPVPAHSCCGHHGM